MQKIPKNLPDSPGVYIFKGIHGKVLYVGKAANLKRRVSSYFQKAHDSKIEKLISRAKKIDIRKTDTAIEALILEAELIKKFEPSYNIRDKDDKSFLYVEITNEEWPRVLLVRGKSDSDGKRYGPFTSASSIRAAMRVIRGIFPYSVHDPKKVGSYKRPCLDCQIGRCPGTCIGDITKTEYRKTIRHIKLFLEGKKDKVLSSLERDMNDAASKLDFEKAEKVKRRIFAIQHIQDTALITRDEPIGVSPRIRVEGYDISNISGTSAVGSMAVFINGRPSSRDYRLFRIRSIKKSDDVGMLKEVISRRLKHDNWEQPDAIMVDGGKPQVNAVKAVLLGAGLKIPVVGIAKGPKRDKNEFIGRVPKGIERDALIYLRDEAHRFAINYHKRLRSRKFINR